MKIQSIHKNIYEYNVPMYDVINANPYNNFLVKSSNKFVVSHNCGMLDEV